MMRLIDADAVDRVLLEACEHAGAAGDYGGRYVLRRCLVQLSALPEAVVRCRDCKWYQEGELLTENKFCFRLKHPKEDRRVGYNFGPEDFCSYGERKDS